MSIIALVAAIVLIKRTQSCPDVSEPYLQVHDIGSLTKLHFQVRTPSRQRAYPKSEKHDFSTKPVPAAHCPPRPGGPCAGPSRVVCFSLAPDPKSRQPTSRRPLMLPSPIECSPTRACLPCRMTRGAPAAISGPDPAARPSKPTACCARHPATFASHPPTLRRDRAREPLCALT